MEFRDNSWANLVFVSTLDDRRTRQEIADLWDIPRQRLEKESVERELARLTEVKILDRNESGVRARLTSQPFQTELESYLTTKHWRRSDDFMHVLVDNLEEFLETLENDNLRDHVFDMEIIQNFYHNDPSEAKENPLNVFYYLGIGLLEGYRDTEFETNHNPDPVIEAAGRAIQAVNVELS